MKKYKLTKEKIEWYGRTLYRIKALKDFNDVKKGDLGGFIESEKNLSQEDGCWIYDDAKVYGNARVCGYAEVYQQQRVISVVKTDLGENLVASLVAQLNIIPVKNKIILYKRVNKINEKKFASCYDDNFVYEIGKIARAKIKKEDENPKISCGTGIHLSTPFYWDEGDSLIACEVNIKDIIAVQEGKVRARKCKVLEEVKIE